MTTPRTRVLIVDDEPLARERIRTLLAEEPGFEIVGEAIDGPSGAEAILALHPDLVFLDVQMPGADGFDVIDAVGPDKMPFVVFVTAYDRYALRAFDVHALDYLLKPFDRERFREALERAQVQIERSSETACVSALSVTFAPGHSASRSASLVTREPALSSSSRSRSRSLGVISRTRPFSVTRYADRSTSKGPKRTPRGY